MEIDNKYDIGDHVKMFKEGVGYICGTIHHFTVYVSESGYTIVYVMRTEDGKSIRLHEESLQDNADYSEQVTRILERCKGDRDGYKEING